MLYIELSETRQLTLHGPVFRHAYHLASDAGDNIMRTGDAKAILEEAARQAERRNDHVTICPGRGGDLAIITDTRKPIVINFWNLPPAVIAEITKDNVINLIKD